VSFAPLQLNLLKHSGRNLQFPREISNLETEIMQTMTTIKITVDSPKNARLLTKLLRTMAFVKSIEEETPKSQEHSQYIMLKNIFNSIEPGHMFRKINNPVEWQKNIRDEWETH
jgi:hypothetical protein